MDQMNGWTAKRLDDRFDAIHEDMEAIWQELRGMREERLDELKHRRAERRATIRWSIATLLTALGLLIAAYGVIH